MRSLCTLCKSLVHLCSKLSGSAKMVQWLVVKISRHFFWRFRMISESSRNHFRIISQFASTFSELCIMFASAQMPCQWNPRMCHPHRRLRFDISTRFRERDWALSVLSWRFPVLSGLIRLNPKAEQSSIEGMNFMRAFQRLPERRGSQSEHYF